MRILGLFWPVWMHLGLNVNRLWFLTFFEAPLIFGNYFKFWCASYQTFSEIRRISEKDWQLSYRNAYVVEEHSRRTAELVINHSRRFYESPRSIDSLCSVSQRTANREKGKLENHGLSCQSVSEIHRIFEKVWYKTHQYFNWLSKIEGCFLKLKNQKWFPFRPR